MNVTLDAATAIQSISVGFNEIATMDPSDMVNNAIRDIDWMTIYEETNNRAQRLGGNGVPVSKTPQYTASNRWRAKLYK